MYEFELCQRSPNEFLKSNVIMSLECGSIHFCSVRANKNTKAFCVARHGRRSALQHTPGPRAASEAELEVRRASCRTRSVFLRTVYNLLSAVPALGADTIKSHQGTQSGSFSSREGRGNVRVGLRSRQAIKTPAKLRTARCCPCIERKIGHGRETLWL